MDEVEDLTVSPPQPPLPQPLGPEDPVPLILKSQSESQTPPMRKRRRMDAPQHLSQPVAGPSSSFPPLSRPTLHMETDVSEDSENDRIVEVAPPRADPFPPPPPSPRHPTPLSSTPTPLAQYTCPICFSPPSSPTLTMCGHIMCGSCLWAALRSARDRALASGRNPNEARCPVCRAIIVEWDWKGTGVIGLETKVAPP